MVAASQMSSVSSSQLAAITSVNLNPAAPTAQGYTRQGTYVEVDLRHHVGAVHVIPAVGEQWYLQRLGTGWVLDRKLPFNTTVLLTLADNPEEGLVQLGSSGPVHVHGSLLSVHAPLAVAAVDASSRPVDVPEGTQVFDTTLHKPIWWGGTTWYDATGNPVPFRAALGGTGVLSAMAPRHLVTTRAFGTGVLSVRTVPKRPITAHPVGTGVLSARTVPKRSITAHPSGTGVLSATATP